MNQPPVAGWIRCCLGFSLLWSAVQCFEVHVQLSSTCHSLCWGWLTKKLHFVVSYVKPITLQYKSELFKKHLCNQNSHYEKHLLCKGSHHVVPPNQHFTVSKDEWNTKEGTGKLMKNVLYILGYAKKHLLGWSDVQKWKKSSSLSHCQITLHQAVSH